MSCTRNGLVLDIYSKSLEKVVKGSDFTLKTQWRYSPVAQLYRVEGFVGATAFFLDEASARIGVTGSLESADLGVLVFNMNTAFTESLLANDEADFEVHMEDESGVIIAQILGKMNIVDQLFST